MVYPERMRKNMDLSRGMVFSQKVLLRLIDAGMPPWPPTTRCRRPR